MEIKVSRNLARSKALLKVKSQKPCQFKMEFQELTNSRRELS